jgi:hypothetical protein
MHSSSFLCVLPETPRASQRIGDLSTRASRSYVVIPDLCALCRYRRVLGMCSLGVYPQEREGDAIRT